MSGVIPTPIYPGIDLNANKASYINAVCGFCIALSFVTLCLRFFSRWWTKVEFGKDDYLILPGVAFAWTFTIMCLVQVQDNFYGQHVGKSDLPHIKRFMKATYILVIIYLPSITSSKLSLLALYWRIFADSNGKWPIIIAAVANILWMIIVSLISIFICRPVHGFWDIEIKSKCLDPNLIFISTEGFTIALDIMVLVMPVYFIKSIKRSLSQRISISSTFLIGLMVTVISCVRLWKLVKAARLPGFDPTFNEIDAGVWGSLELNIWVVVACIPTIRPLFLQFWRNSRTARTTDASRTYVNNSSRGYKARFGLPKSNNSYTLHSRDGPAASEDYNTLVSAKPHGGANSASNSVNNYEMGNFPDKSHGIRVDHHVDVSVRDGVRRS